MAYKLRPIAKHYLVYFREYCIIIYSRLFLPGKIHFQAGKIKAGL